jgi:hypothetical protein
MCELCKKRPAKGGHRFCWRCLGQILSQPAPAQVREEQTHYHYPKRKK